MGTKKIEMSQEPKPYYTIYCISLSNIRIFHSKIVDLTKFPERMLESGKVEFDPTASDQMSNLAHDKTRSSEIRYN